jgi:hypothetical protein
MFYQSSKTAKAAVIGTIMPWSGPLSNIPDGWIICDGSTKRAADYPLLVQVIGDTYNSGLSNLGGSFPEYLGDFVLPNLLDGKTLMDIEEAYFASEAQGGTGNPIDTDPDARSIISPFIGDNVDNGVKSIYTDVFTDVIFTLNDRTGYEAAITGNTIIPGEGEREVYLGGRKLGTSHVKSHGHSGSYETINNVDPTKPGDGVIPYANVDSTWVMTTSDWSDDNNEWLLPGTDNDALDDTGARFQFTVQWEGPDWAELEENGFGNGQVGRVLARVRAEKPPLNILPKEVRKSPISSSLLNPRLESESFVPYGSNESNIQIPVGYRNYYPDIPAEGNFGTLVSNTGGNWDDAALEAHVHDSFTVRYDQGSLKPYPRLTGDVNIPSTTVLDNITNIGALQINMTTTQPSLTCIYIIRAY